MAAPGDPKQPETPQPDVDHDAEVGFSSASSLQGQPRRLPEPEPEPAVEPEPVVVAPTPEPEPEPEFLLEPEPTLPPAEPEPEAAPVIPAAGPAPRRAAPDPTPAWARETPTEGLPAYAGFGTRSATVVEVEGGMGLYAVYALILFAVPTLGVSALIALVAVTGRAGPKGEVAASHFIFQQRTLWAGAVAALLGAILIAVGLGVFVLFVLAVWLILRGAGGVLKLKAGRPIANPRAWLL